MIDYCMYNYFWSYKIQVSSNKSSKTVLWEFIWKIHLVPEELCVIILENFVKCLQWQQQYNHCEDQKKKRRKKYLLMLSTMQPPPIKEFFIIKDKKKYENVLFRKGHKSVKKLICTIFFLISKNSFKSRCKLKINRIKFKLACNKWWQT